MATTKLPDGYTDVTSKTPAVKKSGPVTSTSEVVSFSLENGKTILGSVQRWDRDMNAPHIEAKKGDIVFTDLQGNPIAGVTGWK